MILVADGDPFFRTMIRGVLRAFGANGIVTESDGKEALEFIKAGGVDLVICDTVLNSMRGFELCRAVRALDDPEIKFVSFIILSSHTQFGNVIAARDCGANAVLAKPLIPQLLFDRLIWLTKDKRQMIVGPDFVGPDRRYRKETPPDGNCKRHDD